MAIFALAERLPTSATLPHWQTDSLLLLRLADLEILADEDTNSMPVDKGSFYPFADDFADAADDVCLMWPNLFLPLCCDTLIWFLFRWFKNSLPGSVVPLAALLLYNCSLRITRRRRKQRKSINSTPLHSNLMVQITKRRIIIILSATSSRSLSPFPWTSHGHFKRRRWEDIS